MATNKDYKDFVLDQLNLLNNITYRPMMGEYIIYYKGVIIGGIYDDRLLVKIVDGNRKYDMQEIIPYKNAKPMYLIDDIDDKELLKEIVIDTYNGLIKR